MKLEHLFKGNFIRKLRGRHRGSGPHVSWFKERLSHEEVIMISTRSHHHGRVRRLFSSVPASSASASSSPPPPSTMKVLVVILFSIIMLLSGVTPALVGHVEPVGLMVTGDGLVLIRLVSTPARGWLVIEDHGAIPISIRGSRALVSLLEDLPAKSQLKMEVRLHALGCAIP